MILMPPQTGQMLRTSPQEVMAGILRTVVPLLLGTAMLLVDLMRALMEDLEEEEEAHHMAEAEVLPADQAMDSGKMVNTSLDLPINVSNVNSLAFPTTPQNYIPVSTSRITMTFRLKHPAKMFRSLACSSPTLLWTTIYYPTSASQAIRLPHPCKSTLSPSLWVVET